MQLSSVQFNSVTQSCPTLWDRMDCSTPGFPIHHQLPEFTQIHVHWVSDAIQPSHSLSSPSLPAFNLSQHQGLFRWVSSSYREGNDNPLQYSCLENPMDGGACGLQSMGSLRVGHDWTTSLFTFTFHFHVLEKEMATHSSVLAWRIPGMVEPGGLPSMGLHRVRHDWSYLAAAAAVLRIRWL